MHRGLLYWPKTGAVYAMNADYVCPTYIGSRQDNLENNSKPTVDLHAYGPVWLLEK